MARAHPEITRMNALLVSARRGHALSRTAARGMTFAVLVTSDLLVFLAALAVAAGLRVSVFPAISQVFYRQTYPVAHYLELWWLPLVYLGALGYAGLYTRRVSHWEEVRRCLSGATLWAVLTFAVVSAAKAGDDVSRPVLVLTWAALCAGLPPARALTKRALFALGLWRTRVVILGRGPIVERLARALARDQTLGYEVAEILSEPSLLPERTAVLGANEVVLAATDLDRAAFLSLVERVRGVAENVLIAPDLAEAPVLGVEVLGLLEDRALLLRVPNNLLRHWNLILKRGFDLTLAGALAVVALPVVAVCALLVKLDSPGPAFHVQPRVGRNGRLFPCYKLRTMHTDAPERLHAYFHANPEAIDEWRRFHKLRADDPRVTRLGRRLRRYAVDEIPQLFNVVRGEMSLVGPRPYLPSEIGLLPSAGTLDVRPGMTGLWQVSGKNALDFDERSRMERWYVSNWSLWLDLVVLARTIPAIVKGDQDTTLRGDQGGHEGGLPSAHFGHDVPDTAAPLHNHGPVRG